MFNRNSKRLWYLWSYPSINKFMHKQRVILLILAVIGMSTIFMPWVVYPRIDVFLTGSMGDGWISFALFLIILIIILIKGISKPLSAFQKYTVFGCALLNLVMVVFKIYNFSIDKANFNPEDPYLITATAGSHLGYGLYMLAVISALTLIIVFLFNTRKRTKN